MMIRAEQVCKFYNEGKADEVRALNGVDLEIERNRFAILAGPSGSGKTTLIGLMGAIDRPTSGQIHLDGENLSKHSDVALSRIRRRKVGIVFQSFNLIPRLAAWENVAYPLIPDGVAETQRFERARALLVELGLEDRLYHSPEQLSGGQQQRVAIARALINDPEVLLADEPTSNIDARSIEELKEILTRMRGQGRTLVISTHDAGLMEMADVVFELREGRVNGVRHSNSPPKALKIEN